MKKIFFIFLGINIAYLIMCFFGPKEIYLERNTVIKADKQLVGSKLTDLKFFFDQWSPWTEMDPEMKVTYKGLAGSVGHSMQWESKVKNVGTGQEEITSIAADSVTLKLNFEGQGESKIIFKLKTADNGTNVTWAMRKDVPFFGRAFLLFINIEKMIAPDFEKGLSKLKAVMESLPTEAPATL